MGNSDSLHHTLHFHETGTLDEDASKLREFCQNGRIQGVHVIEMLPLPEAAASALRLRSQREQFVNAAGTRKVTRFRMKLRPLVTDFTHVTHHQKTRAGQLGK